MVITRYVVVVAALLFSAFALGHVAHAEKTVNGLAFQDDVFMEKTDAASYQPTAKKQRMSSEAAIDGLQVADDVLMSPEKAKTPVASSTPSDLLATYGQNVSLEPKSNVVRLKTVRPAPPPPVFWFDRSPLASVDTPPQL